MLKNHHQVNRIELILKKSARNYLLYLTNSINHSLYENVFPAEPKQSEVIPQCKKLDLLNKVNYRPITLLPQYQKSSKESHLNK